MAFVYIIHAVGTDRYKIGFSTDPSRRLQALQTASPHRLRLVGGIECDDEQQEVEFHDRFAKRRATGEWFVFAPQEVEDWLDGATPDCHEEQFMDVVKPKATKRIDVDLPPGTLERDYYDKACQMIKTYNMDKDIRSAVKFALMMTLREVRVNESRIHSARQSAVEKAAEHYEVDGSWVDEYTRETLSDAIDIVAMELRS